MSLLGRLRAWVGSLFGGDADADADESSATDAGPDAESGTESDDVGPDAEPSSSPRPDLGTVEAQTPAFEGDAATDAGGETKTEAEEAATADAEAAYKCSVCGTGVETPDGPCPLCNSTDVVAADEATGRPEARLDPTRVRTSRTAEAETVDGEEGSDADGEEGSDADGEEGSDADGEEGSDADGEEGSDSGEAGSGDDPSVRRESSARDDSAVSRLQELKDGRRDDDE